MSVFYDHLTDMPGLDAELAAILPDPSERAEVLEILDASMHHVVMEVIFTALPNDVHEVFLVDFHGNPGSPTHLPFLRQYHPGIEDDIRAAAHHSKRQFIDTIHAE